MRYMLPQAAVRPQSRRPILLLDMDKDSTTTLGGQAGLHTSQLQGKQPQHSTEVRQPRPTSFILHSMFSIIVAKDDINAKDLGSPNG